MDASQEELFREIILDHHKRPRNRGCLELFDREIVGRNEESGDEVRFTLCLSEDRVEDIRFEAEGSAVLIASCSLLTLFAKGNLLDDLECGIRDFLAMLRAETESLEPFESLGDLVALSGIRKFPPRVRCASLPWRSLQAELFPRRAN